MVSNILENFNQQQIKAVTTAEGYVRVIAGADSGKTKALTSRYAYLVVYNKKEIFLNKYFKEL